MFINPQEVIKNFGLDPKMVVADFGCGSGHYTFAASNIVGNEGLVYAIDVQKGLIQAIKSHAEANKIDNIEIIWADLEKENGSKLADKSVDLVMLSNTLFQSDDIPAILKEAKRVVKDGGAIVVIEWKEDVGKIGPSSDRRVPKTKCKEMFLSMGMSVKSEFEVGTTHYGILFVNNNE